MKKIVSILSLASCALMLEAANPYLPLWEFIPDGEPYVFEDPDNPGQYRVYVYGSHDNLVTAYCGLDQVVWSAPVDNLNDWRYDGIIFESKTNAQGQLLNEGGVGDVLYAPDIAVTTDANGKKTYYLYPNVQNGGRQGLIAKSDRPDGPFVTCNWDAKNPNETYGILRFDPGVFVDDDGRVYGYWGFERSYGAELDPATMCTVKKGTKVVEDMVSGRYQDGEFSFFEASSIRKIKDKYVFIYSRFTKDGEFGLGITNYTLAYAYSNNPLGPWTYGGTIIDGRGKEQQPDGNCVITACPSGNTHGSICEINGKWWVFYHRQAGTNEYSRQAMVAPIDVEVTEGPDGYVKISEGEYTSEGFETDGLNPMELHAAGIACYYTGPEPAHQEYPNVIYPGSHTEIFRTNYNGTTSAYDPSINRCYMVNNTDGSVVGYKYFNFDQCKQEKSLSLQLSWIPQGIDGQIEVWADRPTEAEGGKLITTLIVSANSEQAERTDCLLADQFLQLEGKHALFFVFKSDVKNQSIATLCSFQFVKNVNTYNTGNMLAWGLALVAALLVIIVVLIRKKKQ